MSKYENYKSNLEVLKRSQNEDLHNEFVQSGIVSKFSLQFELGWKLLAKLLTYEGMLDEATDSPRGIIKAAFKTYDFIDEDLWLQMLADRNMAQHLYDNLLLKRLVDSIIKTYVPGFVALLASLENKYDASLLETF